MQISKWGNSLAVRLPEILVEKLGRQEGDDLNVVDVVARALMVEKQVGRRGGAEAHVRT